MKVQMLPVLVITMYSAAALIPSSAKAHLPQIYGLIFLSLDRWDRESDISGASFAEWQLNSNNSRLGVKGETELHPGFRAIYQMEFGTSIDGDDSSFNTRNSFLGLDGAYGTILGGKHDSPTKLIQHDIDQFDELVGDISSVFEGEDRMQDVVLYRSPLLAEAFTVSFAFIPGEDAADDSNDGVTGDGLADGKSVSIEYEPSDSLMLAVGVDRDINGFDLERAAVQYRIGKFQLGAMLEFYENGRAREPVDMRAGIASLSYTQGASVFKVQAGLADSRIDDAQRETLSIGYDHKLASTTRIVSYLTLNKDENASGDETKETVFGLGLEHRF